MSHVPGVERWILSESKTPESAHSAKTRKTVRSGQSTKSASLSISYIHRLSLTKNLPYEKMALKINATAPTATNSPRFPELGFMGVYVTPRAISSGSQPGHERATVGSSGTH